MPTVGITSTAQTGGRCLEHLVEVAVTRRDRISDGGKLRAIGAEGGIVRIWAVYGKHAVVHGERFILVHDVGLALAVTNLHHRAGRGHDDVAFVDRVAELEFDLRTLCCADVSMPLKHNDLADDDVR